MRVQPCRSGAWSCVCVCLTDGGSFTQHPPTCRVSHYHTTERGAAEATCLDCMLACLALPCLVYQALSHLTEEVGFFSQMSGLVVELSEGQRGPLWVVPATTCIIKRRSGSATGPSGVTDTQCMPEHSRLLVPEAAPLYAARGCSALMDSFCLRPIPSVHHCCVLAGLNDARAAHAMRVCACSNSFEVGDWERLLLRAA